MRNNNPGLTTSEGEYPAPLEVEDPTLSLFVPLIPDDTSPESWCTRQISRFEEHFFLTGSSLAVLASILDFVQALQDYWSEDSQDSSEIVETTVRQRFLRVLVESNSGDDDDDDGSGGMFENWTTYKLLMVLSTSLYLMDSLVHIWRQRQGDDDQNPVCCLKHPQRRRTDMELFAWNFGLAAFFDLASSAAEDEEEPIPSFVCEALSVGLFFACALLMIWSKRHAYCNMNNNAPSMDSTKERMQLWLVCVGDFFFLAGCTVDVSVAVLENPWRQATWLVVSSGGLVSSLLWCLDAILYRMAEADLFHGAAATSTSIAASAIPQLVALPRSDPADDCM